MRTIASALVALALLAGIAAKASAADMDYGAQPHEQEDWHKNFGL